MNVRVRIIVFLVLGLSALCGSSSKAGLSAPQYGDGDIVVGFRQKGGTQDYMIDLSQVATLPAGFNFTTSYTFMSTGTSGYGNVGQDLTDIYGATWHNASDNVVWSVFGIASNESTHILYGTSTSGDQVAGSSNAQATPTTDISNLGNNGYDNGSDATTAIPGSEGGATTPESDVGVVQLSGDTNSYTSYQPGGSHVKTSQGNLSFGYFSSSFEGNPTQTLNFDEIVPTNESGGGVTRLGTFSIDALGDITYTANAVPEPSSTGLMAVGLGLLLFCARHKGIFQSRGL